MEYENGSYDIDDTAEDYSDDYDYEADERLEGGNLAAAHQSKKLKANNYEAPNSVSNKQDNSRNGAIEQTSMVGNKEKVNEQKIADLEKRYSLVIGKYKEAKEEINQLKRKKEANPASSNNDERVKQLEDRVSYIKTKAKEKIAEKDQIISEQNVKLKNFEEMLSMLEVNCKQAVVKYNEAQIELAKKEEVLQQHLSFKNRYDYKVNFLDEKCRKISSQYEAKIKLLQERSGFNYTATSEPKVDSKVNISRVTENKATKDVVKKMQNASLLSKIEPESKVLKARGVTIKEVEQTGAEHVPSEESKMKTEESKLKTDEVKAKFEDNKVKTEDSKVKKEEPKEFAANLPGLKITLTEAIDELDKMVE